MRRGKIRRSNLITSSREQEEKQETMATGKKRVIPFHRRGMAKTNYKKRLALLKSKRTRLVVRPTLKNSYVQFVDFRLQGDIVRCACSTHEIKKAGWKAATGNLPSAYLTGLLAGQKARAKGITDAVLDLGLMQSIKASRVYACVRGVLDAGIKVPCSEDVLPPHERISGEHIASFAKMVQTDSSRYAHQYASLQKRGFNASTIVSHFADVKKRIAEKTTNKIEEKTTGRMTERITEKPPERATEKIPEKGPENITNINITNRTVTNRTAAADKSSSQKMP